QRALYVLHRHAMRREIDLGIKAERAHIGTVPETHSTEVDLADTGPAALLAPDLDRGLGVGDLADSVNEQDRLALETEIARVAQHRDDVMDEADVRLERVMLGQKDVLLK